MSEMGRYCCKVFLGSRTKILRAADAFCARRREGPYGFIQNRSRIFVVVLKRDAAAEKPKDQLSRDFLGCSIFDFCNNICQKQMCYTGIPRLLFPWRKAMQRAQASLRSAWCGFHIPPQQPASLLVFGPDECPSG